MKRKNRRIRPPMSEEWKRKISESNRRYFATHPEARQRQSEKLKKLWKNPSYLERQCTSRRSYKLHVKTGRYYAIHQPDHPAATKTGYVAEHRLVMEGILGRLLKSNEVVHHINGNHYDNQPSNLIMLTHSEHSRHHAIEQGLGTHAHDLQFPNPKNLDQPRGDDGSFISRSS